MRSFLVRTEERDGVYQITLHRPEVRNALCMQMWQELGLALDQVDSQPDAVAVVITGAGEHFSVGLDLKELKALGAEAAPRALRIVEETLIRLENLPVPTVAMVRGFALGSGAELALACDLRVAASDARFGLPFARVGLMVSAQMLQRFVYAFGMSMTKELLFTGRHIDAREAQAAGLVNRVVPVDQLDAVTWQIVDEIRQCSPSALRAAKRALGLCQPLTVSYGLPPGDPYFVDPQDFIEGTDAFFAKRRPRFSLRRSPSVP